VAKRGRKVTKAIALLFSPLKVKKVAKNSLRKVKPIALLFFVGKIDK
jgi:hypothetical protein